MRVVFREAGLAGHGINDIDKIGGVEAGLALVRGLRLQKDVAANDLAHGEIAVFDRLRNVVAVGRLAVIADIVGGDLLVLLRALFLLDAFGQVERTRGRGEADLWGRAVAGQHLAPGAPRGTVAFVNHDHVEIVGRVVLGEERDFLLFLPIDAEALVGRDVNARILSRVAALGVARDLGGFATEQVGERRRRLGAQLVAVANKQGAPRHPRVEEPPQHIRRDEGLAGAGGTDDAGVADVPVIPAT